MKILTPLKDSYSKINVHQAIQNLIFKPRFFIDLFDPTKHKFFYFYEHKHALYSIPTLLYMVC